MTAKRFVGYFDKDHNYIIQDLQNEDEYQVGFVNCDEDIFLELINQLSDENEQLRTKNNAYIQDIEVFKEENTHLKLENEELKQFIDDLTTKGTGRIDLANGYSYSVNAVLTNWKGDNE